MSRIDEVSALEILDSRGLPTIKAHVSLDSGIEGEASVPSGASVGKAEAHYLRDGDVTRYDGMGCQRAVGLIEGEICEAVILETFAHQFDLDRFLIALDGTENKARLGANAILAVSMAFARAKSKEQGLPLYSYFADLIGNQPKTLPRPTINLFSGGAHAGGNVAVQDCLIVPVSCSDISTSLSMAYAVYQSAATRIRARYGMRLLTADEGGLSPDFRQDQEMLDCAMDAILEAGLEQGTEIALALDVAASQFYDDGKYHMNDQSLTSQELIDKLVSWIDRYPILSIEDGLAEDAWEHWVTLMRRLEGRTLVLGDDLLCTNRRRIERAVQMRAANALLLKVNQTGTLFEAAEALACARDAGWSVTISARSGETEDDWLADLAVGWSADFIKIGSITQSERLAKYNRLLQIERDTNFPVAPLPATLDNR